jgi:hypothetical protein
VSSKKSKDKIAEAEREDLSLEKGRQELVSLKGVGITTDGKLTKTGFFQFLGNNLDDYSDIVMDVPTAKKVHQHLLKLSTGSAAMAPMYCGGARCPFASRCPLVQMKTEKGVNPTHGRAPVGRQCIIEVELMKHWIIQYVQEYDVDPNNFTEVAYVNELAEIEILLMRLNMNLAKVENAELVIDQNVGISQTGEAIVQKQLSPFMQQKEALQNRRSRIIKLMVGDRQERYKKEAALKIKEDKDPSSLQAEMRRRLEELQRRVGEEIPRGAREDTSSPTQNTSRPDDGTLSPEDIIDSEG